MPKYRSFTELPLWNEAVNFAAEIYLFCETGKLKTDFRMKDQLRGAAASISNNIAEGFEYGNRKNFIRFLTYAKGSAGEVYNQLTILYRAGMIEQPDYLHFSGKALTFGKQIGGFIKYLNASLQGTMDSNNTF
ncbi:four helix bundle protein [Segetibacter sp. 3557_3]|uniref:four helix bundle protein n=1 Tax=Segetibacter sp. 3557_3 TaxID=2547429 RepID=UPI0010588FF5|nr:four helix bundle protein [Segetibacter sp. 3557_3]TDH23219.1 four helix bundle protein [Segetibacter sp. 3557_3]